MFKQVHHQAGFTIIETLIGAAIFVMVSSGIYLAYSSVLDIINIGNYSSMANNVIEAEIEIIRNMKYEDIGIQGGSPPGKLLASKTVTIDNVPLTVNTTIRNIDDPYDGTIGGTPNDLAPADYKLVEIEITCSGCQKFTAARMTTTAAPKSLESASNNGSLFINVFDASGGPLSGTTVNVVNTSVTPNINITETTNINGQLQLVDIATSSGGYQITITKSGYSTDRTYPPGTPPNPVKPHATVAKQQLTIISFAIDRTSTLNIKTQDAFCQPVPNIDILQTGAKLIGTDPSTFKYSSQHVTDAGGAKQVTNLEWDAYTFTNLDGSYDLAGSSNPGGFIVDPNQTYALTWNVEPKVPLAFLATVRTAQGQSIPEATVQLTKTGFDQTNITGRQTLVHTNWSGGNFDSSTSGIETNTPAGQIHLVDLGGGTYASNSEEWLISRTIDFGTGATTLHTFKWNPTSQPPLAGTDSIKFQLAANNDNATWNFTGPDGTSGTYYTSASGTVPHGSLNNKRYLRYKVYVRTDHHQYTPTIDDLSLIFSSACSPANQTLFTGLTSGIFTLTISKTGYQTFTDTNVSITGNWQEYQVQLTPQ